MVQDEVFQVASLEFRGRVRVQGLVFQVYVFGFRRAAHERPPEYHLS